MSKPVEIEFLMKDRLSKGLGKAGQSVEALAKQAKAAAKLINDKVAEQNRVVNKVAADLDKMERQLQKMKPGKAHKELTADIVECQKALDVERNTLVELEKEHKKAETRLHELLEAYNQGEGGSKKLSMRLRELQDTMVRMRLEGKQDSEQYRKMAEEAANLSDAIGDLHTQTKILSNDDANLQGFMSGVSGLSGAFTAATGALSLFASENESLARIQTRLQSVMAITMGLQQAFNTLNKDSAFRLVTLSKAKDMLTAANMRLAGALGISEAAAAGLMATLTLGLSVVVTGLAVAWNRYSEAQEKAAKKARELVEIESDGRAQMVRTRFEIDNTLRELESFTGTREEERKKAEELNRKYGEAFGYYETVAEWYDTLTQKAEDYIQALFLQAKAQSLVNKAVEMDAKVEEAKAKPESEYDTMWGYGGKVDRFFSSDKKYKSNNNGKWIKKETVEALEKERESILQEAADLYRQAAELEKAKGIGGHTQPTKPKTTTPRDSSQELKDEQKRAQELLQLRRENLQAEISLMAEGSERRMRQARHDYENEIEEINELRAKWAEAQNGKLTEGQEKELQAAKVNAWLKMAGVEDEISRGEIHAEEDKYNELLEKYQGYLDKRKAVEDRYNQEEKILRMNGASEGTMAEFEKSKASALNDVDKEFGKSTQAMADLFADASQKSVNAIQAVIDKYQALVDYMQGGGSPEGLSALGFGKEDIDKISRGEIQIKDLTDRIKELRGELANKSSWKAFEKSASDALKKIRDKGSLGEGINDMTAAIHSFMPSLRTFGSSIATIFGNGAEEIQGMLDTLDGLATAGGGIGQIMSGDIVGGAMTAVNGIGQVVSALDGLFGADYSQYNRMKEEYDGLSKIWDELIDKKKDYIGISFGEEAKRAGEEADAIVKKSQDAARQLARERLQSGKGMFSHSIGYKMNNKTFKSSDWDAARSVLGSGFNDVYTLINMSGEKLEELKAKAPTFWAKLDEDFQSYLQDVIDAEQQTKDILDSVNQQLTQMSFDGFYDNFIDKLMDMDSATGDFAADMSEKFARAMLSQQIGAKYRKQLEDWYNRFAKDMEDGILSETERDALQQEYQQIVENALHERDRIAKLTGYGQDSTGISQGAKAGGFNAMTHDQGTKLEGMFTSGMQHWSSMDRQLEDVGAKMNAAESHLARIAENTGASAGHLAEIRDDIKKMIRDGVKMK